MKITEHCYFLGGFFTESPWVVNAGIIYNQGKTLIVDAGSNPHCAATIFGYAEALDNNALISVVNTEPHFDHIGGNSFFADKGIKITGHKDIFRTQKDFDNNVEYFNNSVMDPDRRIRQEGFIPFRDVQLKFPDIYIEKETAIFLGDLEVIFIPTPGHTKYNICVYIPEDKVIYTGDTIVEAYKPSNISGNEDEWMNSLDLIEKLGVEIIVPGHGNLIPKENVSFEIDRIRNLLIHSKEQWQ